MNRHDEDKLDEALEETFPASDAPANTPETGVGARALPDVSDHRAQHRFELDAGGAVAYLSYERTSSSLVLIHTEVPPAARGAHAGAALVEAAVAAARAEGLVVIARCPFARAYLARHPR